MTSRVAAETRHFTIERGGPILQSHGRFGSADVLIPTQTGRTLDGLRYDFPSIGAVMSGVFHYDCAKGYVAGGPGVVICGDGEEEFSVTYETGDVLRRVVVAFEPDLIVETAEACGLPPVFPSATVDQGDRQTRLYGLLQRLSRLIEPDEEAALEVLGLALGAALPHEGPGDHPRARQLRTVAREIARDCAEPWDLTSMAALAGMSRYHFIRSFADVLGETPRQYLVRARLRLAAEQLLDGGPVTSVALNVGFNDISNFNHAFLRTFGASPRKWLGAGRRASR